MNDNYDVGAELRTKNNDTFTMGNEKTEAKNKHKWLCTVCG